LALPRFTRVTNWHFSHPQGNAPKSTTPALLPVTYNNSHSHVTPTHSYRHSHVTQGKKTLLQPQHIDAATDTGRMHMPFYTWISTGKMCVLMKESIDSVCTMRTLTKHL